MEVRTREKEVSWKVTRKKTSDNIQSSREKRQDTIWKHMTARVDKVECDKAGAKSKSEKEKIESRIGEKSTDDEQNISEVKPDFVKQIVQSLDINFEVTPVRSLKSVTEEMKMTSFKKP